MLITVLTWKKTLEQCLMSDILMGHAVFLKDTTLRLVVEKIL